MSELIFVTGATGVLGSHVVNQLLKRGYRVRATARGAKAEAYRKAYADTPALEVVEITDIAHDEFPQALQGVNGIIHVASPLSGRADIEGMFQSAVDGSLNVLRQGEKAGVKRFVVTSSIVTATRLTPHNKYTDQDWSPLTKEAAIESGQPGYIYIATKKYAESAVWKWAEAHPHVEVTTINPPYLYGPLVDNFPIAPLDFQALSTNMKLYQFISPTGEFPPRPSYADFRDVAKAHINALNSPPTADVGRKRVLFSSPDGFKYKKATELIAEKRPEIKDRVNRGTPEELWFDRYELDYGRIEKITGLKKEHFHTIEETLLDTVDSLLALEKKWKSQGYEVTSVPESTV